MSTRYEFVCISHEPWISQDSMSQYNLEELFAAWENREDMVRGMDADEAAGGWGTFPRAAYFFSQHRHCRLLIENEYGDIYDPESGRMCSKHRTKPDNHHCPLFAPDLCRTLGALTPDNNTATIIVRCERSKHEFGWHAATLLGGVAVQWLAP